MTLDEPITNWIDQAEVEYKPQPSTTVLSVRLSPAHLAWVFDEADRHAVQAAGVIVALVSHRLRTAWDRQAGQRSGMVSGPACPSWVIWQRG